MSLTARWILSVELVLYQEATAFRIFNEVVIPVLVLLLFWGEHIRFGNFSQSPAAAPAVIPARLILKKKHALKLWTCQFEDKALFSWDTIWRFLLFLFLLRLVLLCWSNRDRPWVGGEESKLGSPPRQQGAAASMQDSASDSKMAKQVSTALISLADYD